MKCLRCAGLMVIDQCFQEDPPEVAMVNRCLNCGDIMDPTILVNRQACPSFCRIFFDQAIGEALPVPLHRSGSISNAA
ncbi:MAG: hypothetical protein R3351_01365 [Nitrospirales bacterium]|nr:hypothetical protein [Nitrospirales bacterium]